MMSPVPITLSANKVAADGVVFDFMIPCEGDIAQVTFFAKDQNLPLEAIITVADKTESYSFTLPIVRGINTARDCGRVAVGDLINIKLNGDFSPVIAFYLTMLIIPHLSHLQAKTFVENEDER